MCEVNIQNFNEKYDEIKQALHNAKFIAIDCEFSALYPLKNQQPSLFDKPCERYTKLRKNVEEVIPIQIGLTAFSFDPNKNRYSGSSYNFYVIPASFPGVRSNFYFQTASINFLRLHKFDFNKFGYFGIPYLNKVAEEDLRNRLKNDEISEVQCNFGQELDRILLKEGNTVKEWYNKSKDNDFLVIPNICEKYGTDLELLYFVHKNFRSRFKNLWTSVENNEFIVRKLPEETFNSTVKNNSNLEDDLLQNLVGFSRVFQLLTQSKKPVVGHNLLQDLVIMMNCFHGPLPHSYSGFKILCHSFFPEIYDTKSLSYELRGSVPKEKCWDDTGLESLFDFFKNGTGRHLALNSPAIEIEAGNYGNFHEAGWDSFCAGYIFVRLAYLHIFQKFPKSKNFMSSELIGGLAEYKNRVNVIRGSTSYIKIDGDDPVTSRPPWLVIESIKNKPVNINQVTSVLSSFGFVEIKKIPYKSTRALIVVDNFGNARRILNNFKSHSEYQIKKYNAFKHSPIIRAFILSSITVSGALLLWFTHSTIKK